MNTNLTEKPLKYLYIYLASDCNLSCQHCWVETSPKVTKYRLKFDNCKDFLTKSCELGLKDVTLSGGEPFLNEDIFKFLDFFKENNINVSIETNGILLNNSHRDDLIKYKPYLCISLDGLNKKVHEEQRGSNTYDKVWDVFNMLESTKLKYQIITAVSKKNYKDISELCEIINKKLPNCDTLKINIITPDGRAKKMQERNMLLSIEELLEFKNEINELHNKYSTFNVTLHMNKPFLGLNDMKSKFTCGGYCGIASAVSVLPDGQISICSLGRFVKNEYIFGGIENIDLEKVWKENPLLLQMRSDEFPDKLKGICSNCIFKRQCRGACRAYPLNSFNDIFGPFHSCQSLYEEGLFPKEYLIDPNKDSHYLVLNE